MSEMLTSWLPQAIWAAGAGQILLIIGSLAIPRVLDWRAKLQGTSTLIRQMFWVYSVYIWGTNLCFGLVSVLATDELLDGSALASCVTGFIFGYWVLRLLIQWFYFDISELATTPFHVAARWTLEVLFTALTAVYGLAMCHNLGWL